MAKLNDKLLSALAKAQRKADGDYDAFREQILKTVDAIEDEAGKDMDDDLAEAIDAIRHPDADDIDLVVDTVRQSLLPTVAANRR